MFRLIVNIFVSFFIKKSCRADVKKKILSFPHKMQVKRKAKRVGKNFCCSGVFETKVNKRTSIGDNTSINGLTVYGSGEVLIGSNVSIGADCVICSDNHNYEGAMLPYDENVICKTTEICDCVWIGAKCIILPGSKIGEGAIIQAGSVVHGVIPPCSIAGGNPAVVFKYRDKEHFKQLKEQNNFIRFI